MAHSTIYSTTSTESVRELGVVGIDWLDSTCQSLCRRRLSPILGSHSWFFQALGGGTQSKPTPALRRLDALYTIDPGMTAMLGTLDDAGMRSEEVELKKGGQRGCGLRGSRGTL